MGLPVQSTAMDRTGYDQAISGSDPVVIEEVALLYDTEGDYNTTNHQIDVVDSGVRMIDIQLKLTDITNCNHIELAVFKRGDPDDYWFVIDTKDIGMESSVQIGGCETIDMYTDESYCIKLILTPSGEATPSCNISQDNDYTAWTYTFLHQL